MFFKPTGTVDWASYLGMRGLWSQVDFSSKPSYESVTLRELFPATNERPYGLLIFSITNSWWIFNEIIVADVGEFRYFERYTCKDGKDGKENSMGGMVAETCWPQDKVWMSKTIKNINIYKSTDGLVPLCGCEIIKPTTKCICKTSQEVGEVLFKKNPSDLLGTDSNIYRGLSEDSANSINNGVGRRC